MKNEIYSAQERIKAIEIWESREIINGGRVLVFEQFCSIWKEQAKGTIVEFAVLPTSPTQWSVLSIDSALYPLPFEEEIKGMMSNPEQFVFAHKGRFTAGFSSKEAAIEVASKL